MITADEPVQTTAVPARLIREVLNGRPLYYKGYRDVLAGRVKPEEIMGCNDIQSIVSSISLGACWSQVDREKYVLALTGGLYINPQNRLTSDIAIFDKATLPALKGKYFDVPPKVMVEVDIRIDWDEDTANDVNYVLEKSQTLFDFGVERVLWVLTTARKVVIMQAGQDWIITDWSNDVPVLDGCVLNIKKLLDEEEIIY